MSRVQLFEVSTAYQIMVLAAAIDAGEFEAVDERILLVSVNTPVPELAQRPDEARGIAPLLSRWDRVVSLNDLLAPVHPAAFRPRQPEQPLFERLLRRALDVPLDAGVELVVESVQAPPSRSLLLVFGDAEATVYGEGLMSYGPTREALPVPAVSRVGRVLHLDLVPGLNPLLLSEFGVVSQTVPDDAFRAVVAEVAAAAQPEVPVPPGEPYALVLAQYLAQLGVLGEDEEAELIADLVRAAAARGHRHVVIKPHPSAPPDELAAAMTAAPGVRVTLLRDAAPVEAVYATRPPALVLGCFSTGLVTATRYWGIPAGSLGVRRVLARLPMFQDSNRVPLAIVDRVVPAADGSGGAADPAALQRFIDAVGYTMQWRAHALQRDAAVAEIQSDPDAFAVVVPRMRLRMLGLPGGLPVTVPADTFARATGTAERLGDLRAAVGRRLSR